MSARSTCAIKDVYSNQIAGSSIDSRMKASLAVTTYRAAVARRGAAGGCVVHSDHGSQFQARNIVHELAHHDLRGSMGRVGACADNAAMESHIAVLQNNVLDRKRWSTRQELRMTILTWIEKTYHH